MTIVMRGGQAGGDSPQENVPNPPESTQQPQQQQPPPPQQTPATSTTQPPAEAENGQGDGSVEMTDDQEPEFPVQELARLDEMINRPRWVVPVLPKGELEILLEAATKLCKDGLDTRSEACQRFFREGLTVSFTKIMTDEAVSGWKYEIHRYILKNAEKLVELCVAKLAEDWYPLLELLAMVLNPHCKFHTYNGTRQSESVQAGVTLPDDALFARPPDPRTPRGWLVDLVNRFGELKGFQILLKRFQDGPQMSVPLVAALIKPFGQCNEVLTPHTVEKYMMPIVEIVPKFLDSLTDEELKKETKTEAKNDALSSIIKALKQLVSRLPDQEETIKNLEIFRLKMILRLLQISSFNGKMNALNEVNKVISMISNVSSRHSSMDEDEWLTAEKMADWVQNNQVLTIVLRDSLHQPQYVEKLEKILRFMIKEKALTSEDLDKLWEAQSGKHDAIVKNVHDLLAKLAWDFSPEQLDHLFECFQGSWTHASKKQREKLLELIRRLAEDDKEGVMAHKVLGLLWNLAHSEDVPTDIMDQALTAHIKILDYSCSQDRDQQKMTWIGKFVDELKNDKWVLPALKQIREICQLFPEAPQNFPHAPPRTPHVYYRNNVINQLQSTHSIVMLVAKNLSEYMEKSRVFAKEHPDLDPATILPDGRFNHVVQIQERLKFMRFLLKDGQLWLCESQARQIWQCLAENAIYGTDRESCFKWFAKLMGEEPDLDPEITRDFFEQNILQLDPSLLTENGMNCFERFFKHVNLKENKLIAKRRGGHMIDDLELIGLDYLWRAVLLSPDDVANKAITLLKDIFTNLGPRLQQNQVDIHDDFIQSCVDRLKALYDTVSVLEKDKDSTNRVMQETSRMVRVLTVLKEYVAECDEAYTDERSILPLSRACRGKLVTLIVRFPSQGRQMEDIEIWSHSNDTIGQVRRQILYKLKLSSNIKVDLYVNNELLDPAEDKRLILQVPLREKADLRDALPLNMFPSLYSYSTLTTPGKQFSASILGPSKMACYFLLLLVELLNYACSTDIRLPNADKLLHNEILWLKKLREQVLNTGEVEVEDALLEGHLGITRELLAFQTPEKRYHIGSEKGGSNLIKELIEDFLFPASKIVHQSRKVNGEFPTEQANPVCTTPLTITAAFDLLVALCTQCVPNLKCVALMLMEMFYNNDASLTEWEYLPPVGPRPHKGFVGLKNAGATCYMNSVIQQLFMIDNIRSEILAIDGAADEACVEEDYVDEKVESETNVDMGDEERKDEEKPVSSKDDERKEYNMGVLKQIQLIFGHLACSKLQFYVPRGFWKHFKLSDEPVNLREQHDALEFFNSLVDSADEALKVLNQPQILSKVLGGSFADQKICKDCPHRYQREESFTALNIDIRNHHNLLESLEQYVKGDLLEGANAYRCEKCDKKVDTVKRLLIKKLPQVLAIQLKRFDYDWERECAIKFNDYFEFPREFDIDPYTVQGMAKIEGEIIDIDESKPQSTKYKLIGVVVHSGQASGGHYYSYILHRGEDNTAKWYKFDDGDVSECKMDDDEELKNQCFGGEYLGEVFDHMLKRMAYRKQKRWWNAYILFYERVDEVDNEKHIYKTLQDLTIVNKPYQVTMPTVIEKCVRKRNIMFMHEKSQFCVEYFHFMKKLLNCNPIYTHCPQDKLSNDAEVLAMISTELASKFLFNVGFRTKKNIRGPASEWYETLSSHLRPSKKVRSWFANNVLFAHPNRFAEYLLECPTSEVRSAFSKIIVSLSHFSVRDGPSPPPLVHGLIAPGQTADPNMTLSDHLLLAVLQLLKKEVSEHGRHLQQYFHLFLMYASLGPDEKLQLLKLNVPAMFMLVALDEGPGPPIKYQYAELNKLYSVVSILVRCCDVSTRCLSYAESPSKMNPYSDGPPKPNPFGDPSLPTPLMPIQQPVIEPMYGRTSYVKKLIEDCNSSDDTAKLLKFCSWENPHFSSTVLGELLWQVAYSYTYELRPYLDLLLQMLLLEDTWQNHRIHNALKGIDEKDGLFDTIQRAKNHYQKRAYQCIKMMVSLFSVCRPAKEMLQSNGDLKRKWTWAVEWLNDELERRPYPGNTQYTYNNWSPPAQSNETSNGYFLERSNSAKITLNKAYDLLPEEEPEDSELTDEHESPHPEEGVGTYPPRPAGSSPQPVEKEKGKEKEKEEKETDKDKEKEKQEKPENQEVPPKPHVQNNQVNTSQSQQPIPPSNQINNQLNNQQPDTGEEEGSSNSNNKTSPAPAE
ncbi:ubiquitin carboxyl-terminal hydrolase 9/24 [Mytilus galloprovincialis]|uniref:Ubiquitin carboxyl-terminal hydrolase 9/24 n=1 Tax=Mytilus galloprovincialis TaxID=29158 RepID=A0A8B6BZS0_MYTGA|nr:ubiquitin carboxyl-terminal hydrolase 9/24 [Mytilus galloprovincialis]